MASFVPKVHPLDRAAEPEDPLSLNASLTEGDPEFMLRCVVEEYAWMGWNLEQLLGLFRDPFYPALYGMWSAWGEEVVRSKIGDILRRVGAFRFETAISEMPEPEAADLELVEIGLPAAWQSASQPMADASWQNRESEIGGRHADRL